ncbi:SH3 domain-containing protein [Gemmobacter denitrificans]|uniref:SH3 domain-containing protein n=1 Tax=Gemmobacter denitrificans TaxID=3123040 RepID=A0ABU8C086_9RHOB
MRRFPPLALISLLLAVSGAPSAFAQQSQLIDPVAVTSGLKLDGQVKGDASVDYLVEGQGGQMLSVDLSSANPSLYFNIQQQGAPEAIFIGSTSGNVADVSLPATGTYVVSVYLMRNAARRDEAASYTLGIGLAGGDFADGLAGGPDWWQVTGLSEGALNIRSGPDLRYDVVGKAQNGEVMQNRGCRMTGPDRWCNIRVYGSGVEGWVAGTHLTEAAAPPQAQMPEGGPVGNGIGFDATGSLPCVTAAGAAPADCLFGVVRDGPGNAGVWIAIGGGVERQVLFKGGVPVSATAPQEMRVERDGDIFRIILGDERYDIYDAIVNGG